MSNSANNQDAYKQLAEKIKDIKTAMFVTADENGELRARPMRHQEMDENGIIWFFTSAPSGKTNEIKQDAHINLSYANPDDQKFVSVSGTAQVIKDQAMIDKFWSPELKAWFPDGKNDPNLALIKVTPTKGEYWDSPGNVIIHAFGLAKATLTGKSYEPGDNQKVSLT